MSAPGHHSGCKSTLRAEIASCCQPDAVAAELLIRAALADEMRCTCGTGRLERHGPHCPLTPTSRAAHLAAQRPTPAPTEES